jgi:hypothetical protein
MLKYTKTVVLVDKNFADPIKEGVTIEVFDPIVKSFIEMTIIREGSKNLTNQELLGLNPDYSKPRDINLKDVITKNNFE